MLCEKPSIIGGGTFSPPKNRELLHSVFLIKMKVKPPSPFNSWVSRRRTSCHSALATVCDLSLMGFFGWVRVEKAGRFVVLPGSHCNFDLLIQIGSFDFQELFFVSTSEGQWSVI